MNPGGAKNHLVALPDCDAESAAHDIVSSFAGAAGQRCMAASVLVLVGDTGANAETGAVSQPRRQCGSLDVVEEWRRGGGEETRRN